MLRADRTGRTTGATPFKCRGPPADAPRPRVERNRIFPRLRATYATSRSLAPTVDRLSGYPLFARLVTELNHLSPLHFSNFESPRQFLANRVHLLPCFRDEGVEVAPAVGENAVG